jgi:hypothetical protein
MFKYYIRLSEYFDDLISELDFAVETSIANNIKNEEFTSKLNAQREVFLKEIDQVKAFNLKLISAREIEADELFPQFCFFISINYDEIKREMNHEDLISEEIGLVLFVTDKYLSAGQISCFENTFNYLYLSSDKYNYMTVSSIKYEHSLDLDLFFVGANYKVITLIIFFIYKCASFK